MNILRRLPALLLLLAAACDSPTAEPPPPVVKPPALPKLAAGTTVTGQVEPGKVVEYELVNPSTAVRILLLAESDRAQDTLVAALVNEKGQVAASVRSSGADSLLSEQASRWATPDAESTWRVQVAGIYPGTRGAFQLRIFPRDDAPESRSPAISVGETVEGEALDVGGDVDEFVVEGEAGEEWIVFAQARTAANRLLVVDLVERATSLRTGQVMVSTPTAELEQASTGRLVLPRGGSYTVRVSGSTATDEPEIPYRFRIARVDRAPESGSSALVPGAVAAGAVETVGDIDEFTFTGSAGLEMNLLVQLESGLANGLTVALLRDGGGIAEVTTNTAAASLDEAGTGRITLPASGEYTVRVSGRPSGTVAQATGSYRFELYPVDRGHEHGGALRIDGATVEGAVDRPGDVDEFDLPGTEGQLIVLHLAGPAPQGGVLVAEVFDPLGILVGTVHLQESGTRYGRRSLLAATGTYRVRVSGGDPNSFAAGSYELGAYTVSPAPEERPAAVQVGDTVVSRIDRPGDLDVYTLQGEPGQEFVLYLRSDPGVGMMTLFAAEFAFTSSGAATLDGRSTGRMTLGEQPLTIRVDGQSLGSFTTDTHGGYALRVFPLNRAPEGRSAAYVLGDTVRGEPLYPAADVDEYHFELAATTSLDIHWVGPASSPADFVFGRLYPEGQTQPVWTSRDNDGAVRQITLPAGRYRLSVMNPNLTAPSQTAQGTLTRLDYSFAFIP